MFSENTCKDTVSLLEAIFFGTNGACISLGPGSLLGGVVIFILAVVILKVALSFAISHAFSHRKALRADRASPLARDGGVYSDSLFSDGTPLSEPAAPPKSASTDDPGPIKSFDRR